MIVDLSPVSFVDATAVQRFDELREELAAQGITLGVAHAKRQLRRVFEPRWVAQRRATTASLAFPTIRSAVQAFTAASAAGGTQAAGICDPVALDRAVVPGPQCMT